MKKTKTKSSKKTLSKLIAGHSMPKGWLAHEKYDAFPPLGYTKKALKQFSRKKKCGGKKKK